MFAGYWHQIPFVRIIIPITIGIGINMFFPLSIGLSLVLSATSFICLCLIWYFYRLAFYDFIFGIFFNLFFFFSGVLLNNCHNHLNYSNHFTNFEVDYLVVELVEPSQLKQNSIKCKVSVLQTINEQQTNEVDGYLVLYFEKDTSLLTKLTYGTRLLIKNNATEISGPQNPFEFNYKRYLAFNQIYRQAYLNTNNFIILEQKGGNFIQQIAYQAQAFFNTTLLKYVKSSSEIAISKALLYGYDDDIDPELIKAYSNTGTLHVLAVSGMHVGLIFWIINLILKHLDKKKNQKIIKAIISLFIIWSYSILCGLSPSILRASVMFSFVAIGSIQNKKPNIFNTLAASAFALLIYDSNMLSMVGFQLSFLAVLGIVSIQKYIKKWVVFNSYVGNEIWNIISVSIAAQLVTFPLGFLYFHQFPIYFIASNLLIIPLTTFIIFAAIGMIFFAALAKGILFLNSVAVLLGFIVKWLIHITNIIVVWLEKLPFSYITGIQISELETILIFIAVCLITYYFIDRKQYYFKYALVFFLLVFLVSGVEKYKNSNQKFITIYNIKQTFAMQIVDGIKSTLIADTSLLNNEDKFHFHLQQHIWASGIKHIDTIPFNNNLQVEINSVKYNIGNTILPNHTNIITGYTYLDSSVLKSIETPIIISSKLTKKQSNGLVNFLNKNKILVNNVLENGAITLNIEQ